MYKFLILLFLLFFGLLGDLVWSYNTVTGQVEQAEVTETFVLQSDHVNYLTILDENGEEQIIETTDAHPFFVVTDDPDLDRAVSSVVDENGQLLYHEDIGETENGFWVEAKDLRVGDVFLDANGKKVTLTQSCRTEYEDGVTVYNFEMAGNHNYFVIAAGELGQTCILVHNACPNGGVGPQHGGVTHNAEIDAHIAKLKRSTRGRIQDIRKNQNQVDVTGKEIGKNRPDIQFDFVHSDGHKTHFNIEFDNQLRNSLQHGATIRALDPQSVTITRRLR